VYALGVVFQELSGRSEWEKRVGRRKFDAIAGRCVEVDRARRFPDGTGVAEALRPRSRRWFIAVAAAMILAALSAAVAPRRAAPVTHVRLALAPSDTSDGADKFVPNLTNDLSGELRRVRNSARATHALRVRLNRNGAGAAVHVAVTNAISNATVRSWDAEYDPAELGYIPGAVAGVVTAAFHLHPPLAGTGVSAAAKQDFEAGLALVRREKEAAESHSGRV
jgi:hypothetical protein